MLFKFLILKGLYFKDDEYATYKNISKNCNFKGYLFHFFFRVSYVLSAPKNITLQTVYENIARPSMTFKYLPVTIAIWHFMMLKQSDFISYQRLTGPKSGTTADTKITWTIPLKTDIMNLMSTSVRGVRKITRSARVWGNIQDQFTTSLYFFAKCALSFFWIRMTEMIIAFKSITFNHHNRIILL